MFASNNHYLPVHPKGEYPLHIYTHCLSVCLPLCHADGHLAGGYWVNFTLVAASEAMQPGEHLPYPVSAKWTNDAKMEECVVRVMARRDAVVIYRCEGF